VVVAQPLIPINPPASPAHATNPTINRFFAFIIPLFYLFITFLQAGLGSILQPPDPRSQQCPCNCKDSFDHLRENLDRKSRTACRLFSGWSPGISWAIAITAPSKAVIAPSQASQSCEVIREMMVSISVAPIVNSQ